MLPSIRVNPGGFKQTGFFAVLASVWLPTLLIDLRPVSYRGDAALLALAAVYGAQVIVLLSMARRGSEIRYRFLVAPAITAALFALGLALSPFVDSTVVIAGPELRGPWSALSLAVTGIPAVALSAFREELLYRSYLVEVFEVKTGPWPALGISTLLFVVGHAYNGPVGMIFAALASIVFGTVYIYRRDVVELGLAHGAYNVIAYMLSL